MVNIWGEEVVEISMLLRLVTEFDGIEGDLCTTLLCALGKFMLVYMKLCEEVELMGFGRSRDAALSHVNAVIQDVERLFSDICCGGCGSKESAEGLLEGGLGHDVAPGVDGEFPLHAKRGCDWMY